MCVSVPPPHPQLMLSSLFNGPVDDPNFFLGQSSLHVAVDDSVAVALSLGPGGRKGGILVDERDWNLCHMACDKHILLSCLSSERRVGQIWNILILLYYGHKHM